MEDRNGSQVYPTSSQFNSRVSVTVSKIQLLTLQWKSLNYPAKEDREQLYKRKSFILIRGAQTSSTKS